MKKIKYLLMIFAISIFAISCNNEQKKTETNKNDSTQQTLVDTSKTTTKTAEVFENEKAEPKTEQSKILIYNFHVTNRCASCVAIEKATQKTLDSYFANELKNGRIKLSILNVDDEANKKISEKYQAFGSSLFVTRVFKTQETTTDLTGEGFKFARNKEEKFIEILKNKITEYLK